MLYNDIDIYNKLQKRGKQIRKRLIQKLESIRESYNKFQGASFELLKNEEIFDLYMLNTKDVDTDLRDDYEQTFTNIKLLESDVDYINLNKMVEKAKCEMNRITKIENKRLSK